MKKLLAFIGLSVGAMFASNAYAAHFQSPSGNIYCSGDNAEISCLIWETAGASGCTATIFRANRHGATRSCMSDVSSRALEHGWGGGSTLGYGQMVHGHGWSCTSAKSGMTCKTTTGRGFKLSRARSTTF